MKIGERLKQILGVAAPTIGTALGGPLGGLAGTFVSKALGVDDEQAALAKLDSDPSAMVALRQADLDFQKHLADCNIDLEKIAAADRASARDLAIKTSSLPQIALSALFVAGYFIILVMFFYHPTGVPMSEAFTIMLGVLTAGMSQVLNYFLGSSSGSAAKTETIASIVKHP